MELTPLHKNMQNKHTYVVYIPDFNSSKVQTDFYLSVWVHLKKGKKSFSLYLQEE